METCFKLWVVGMVGFFCGGFVGFLGGFVWVVCLFVVLVFLIHQDEKPTPT